jgi:hypothetical protein
MCTTKPIWIFTEKALSRGFIIIEKLGASLYKYVGENGGSIENKRC